MSRPVPRRTGSRPLAAPRSSTRDRGASSWPSAEDNRQTFPDGGSGNAHLVEPPGRLREGACLAEDLEDQGVVLALRLALPTARPDGVAGILASLARARLVSYIALSRSPATSASNCPTDARTLARSRPLAVAVSTEFATRRIGTFLDAQRSNSRESSATERPNLDKEYE